MFALVPAWDGLHPAVIHFPIALLLVAPLFLIVGAVIRPDRGRVLGLAALALMILGTAGVWLAVATGEAAAEVTEHNAAINTTLKEHEELADLTRGVFTGLTLAYAAIVLLPLVMHTERKLVTTALPLLFVLLYAAGAFLLANTAHYGGKLVHELGSSAVAPAVAHAAQDD